MQLNFDVNDLTLGDMEDFENVTGLQMMEVLKDSKRADGSLDLPIKALTALVWLIQRKTNPDYTIDMARATKISELEVDLGATPTEAAGSSS